MQDKPQPNTMPRLGLSHGDINGISYEIILKAFADARILTLLTPVLYGQSKVFSYYKKNFGIEDFNYSLTRDARQAWAQKFNIINIVDRREKMRLHRRLHRQLEEPTVDPVLRALDDSFDN